MNDIYTDFLVNIIKKINSETNEDTLISELLDDICNFLGFSCGFVYQSQHTSTYNKKYCYQSCDSIHLKTDLDLKDVLGEELMSELSLSKLIMFSEHSNKTPLQEKFSTIFNANTFILIPINYKKDKLVAFIGLADHGDLQIDLDNACAVLYLLANKLKLQIAETRITTAEQALTNVLDHVGIDIYVNDYYTHEILYANKSMALPYGGVAAMLGKVCWGTIFNDKTQECEFCPQTKILDEDGNPTKIFSWDYQRPFDGAWFRVLSSAFAWVDGRIAHLVASVDITENKNNELLVQKLAEYDHLTGIANRRKLLKDVEIFIEDETFLGNSWYMLFCDLDGFKQINDEIGHRAGDELLKSIGNKLEKNPLFSNTSYRHGGDEFVILLPKKRSSEQLLENIKDLMLAFTGSCIFEDKEISCGCSIGAVCFPIDGTTSEELLHRADMAMYASKDSGKGTVRFYNEGTMATVEEYFFDRKF